MSERYTASTITDDALDALYANASKGWRRGDIWKAKAQEIEADRGRLTAELEQARAEAQRQARISDSYIATTKELLKRRTMTLRNRAETWEQYARRFYLAWKSARRRARVMSDELTRRAPLTGQYAAALARVRAVADRIEDGAPWTANHDQTAHRIRAALDGTPPCACTYGERCPNCRD
ncbi:hypothetical protein ACFVIN_01420 [Streptomyces prasinus]|uniref:hypothetical protein n=1 Tax=Streptomyces prasinus TaxID=67345 RepID=UPI003631A2CB